MNGPAEIELTIFSKIDCELCEPFKASVAKVATSRKWRERVRIRHVDIGSDAEAFALYREKIPVLEVNGKMAFKYFLSEEELGEYLDRRFRE